jgi:8-oxo-dGTP pyrophosphatase MutT (NUDIX family)
VKQACGGVVIDAQGRVLLREPTNHYDGYVWTFPKGRPDPGETPEACALRETQEETGIHARIVRSIPGTFQGGTTSNTFFLMAPVEDTGKFDWETSSIQWATPDEARALVALTTNATGRLRDLAVLEAALTAHRAPPEDQDAREPSA